MPSSALDDLRTAADTELARRIMVYPSGVVGGPGSIALQPVAGRHHLDRDAIVFVPALPFLAGRSYTVLVHRSLAAAGARPHERPSFELDDYDTLEISSPASPTAATTQVVEIYPTVTEIPRNQLRCYVHFSAPMSEGFAASHVRVIRAGNGEPVDAALLSMEPELWDPPRRRLTVLFDPARIKRGLAPHREAGYPLREGHAVELVVDRGFRDADGRPLVADASRRYGVGADIRSRVEPERWRLRPPRPGTRGPLGVAFDRPLDHALLQHCLVVTRGGHQPIAGVASTAPGETSWTFTPAEPWAPTAHALVVDAMLEDVAGNSVVRVFDRDLTDPAHTPRATDHVTLEFHPS